jgi:hypothetical protein
MAKRKGSGYNGSKSLTNTDSRLARLIQHIKTVTMANQPENATRAEFRDWMQLAHAPKGTQYSKEYARDLFDVALAGEYIKDTGKRGYKGGKIYALGPNASKVENNADFLQSSV